jgi:hypothetical protein
LQASYKTNNIMSAYQTELRVIRYQRLLIWLQEQQDVAPINALHHQLLWTIYDHLINNADIWGSPDAQTLCSIADTIVALYDRPLDVVDLTRDEGGLADDSGIME